VGSKTHQRLSFLVSFTLLPFSFFLSLSFLLSGGSPFFFGELYRCSTLSWPVSLSRWLSTGGYGGLEQQIQGSLPSRGGALAGARLEHVPRRGTVVQAVFLFLPRTRTYLALV